jgi:hypothetical protein
VIARLTDPWFDAEFYGCVTETSYRRQGPTLYGAQGLFLWCPCGFGKQQYPIHGGRPHGLLIPFANPQGAPPAVDAHCPVGSDGKTRQRWTMAGTGLADLSLTPSVDVGTDHCWHSYITNGAVL